MDTVKKMLPLHSPKEQGYLSFPEASGKDSSFVEMARGKSTGLLGLLGIFLGILIIVPLVKVYFPGVFSEGFINVRCEKTTCPEGTFCEKAYSGAESCVPIYVGAK